MGLIRNAQTNDTPARPIFPLSPAQVRATLMRDAPIAPQPVRKVA
ncbi:hypothetical protein [Pseudaestuariivita atlantica]|nr:hypothetical protein [Pseudaestuariivita atlantica]